MSVSFYKLGESVGLSLLPMVRIRDEEHQGSFAMGGPDLTFGNPTPHWVRLPKGFDLSVSHVTEDQFRSVMNSSESGRKLLHDIAKTYQNQWERPFGGMSNEHPIDFSHHPMTCVSWQDQKVFFEIVNKMAGIKENKIRRPTEAEMEYAMRGGWVNVREQAEVEKQSLKTWEDFLAFTQGRYENFVQAIDISVLILNGDDRVLKDLLKNGHDVWAMRVYGTASGRLDESVWWDQLGKGKSHQTREVRTLFDDLEGFDPDVFMDEFKSQVEEGRIHPYGLTDANGNVYSWCEDDWDESAYAKQKSGVENPMVKFKVSDIKVVRGGSWGYDGPDGLRTADRDLNRSGGRSKDIGFRCARGPQDLK
ncbi:MAG: SUMF1/EgtB/PvdO family nonheme iron enzyme [Deltaproteobacteria bacterium]|nr:MAG: SUMF1/EgtB/PvdO family nonheme iron enzyme [Deltaproteobacteria bacterium]